MYMYLMIRTMYAYTELYMDLTNSIISFKPRPQGDHPEAHGEGGGEEGWSSNVHATTADQENESRATDTWSIFQHNCPAW